MKFQPAQRDCLPTSKCHGAIYDPGKLPLRSGAKLDRARREKVLHAASRLSDPRKVYFLQETQVEASLDLSPPGPPKEEINTLETAAKGLPSPPLTHWGLAPSSTPAKRSPGDGWRRVAPRSPEPQGEHSHQAGTRGSGPL